MGARRKWGGTSRRKRKTPPFAHPQTPRSTVTEIRTPGGWGEIHDLTLSYARRVLGAVCGALGLRSHERRHCTSLVGALLHIYPQHAHARSAHIPRHLESTANSNRLPQSNSPHFARAALEVLRPAGGALVSSISVCILCLEALRHTLRFCLAVSSCSRCSFVSSPLSHVGVGVDATHKLRAMVRAAAKTLPRPHAHLGEGASQAQLASFLASSFPAPRSSHSQRRQRRGCPPTRSG